MMCRWNRKTNTVRGWVTTTTAAVFTSSLLRIFHFPIFYISHQPLLLSALSLSCNALLYHILESDSSTLVVRWETRGLDARYILLTVDCVGGVLVELKGQEHVVGVTK